VVGFNYTKGYHMQNYNNKVIITCALTGGVHGKKSNPNLPEQPDEIVAQGIAAAKAGAAILHLHARNPDGSNVTDKEIYRGLHERLCAETDAVINITTGCGLGVAVEKRREIVTLTPEICSLNMGLLNFFIDDQMVFFSNDRPDIHSFAEKMEANGVKPELEVYNISMLEEVELLIKTGLIKPPYAINLVLNTPTQGGLRGNWQNLFEMVRRLPSDSICTVSAMGRSQLPLTSIAMAMGLHIRIGMEDNVYYRHGELVKDNAQLVARTVRIAKELQLEPATPDEARAIMSLKGREKGKLPVASPQL
jgi:3-keto-5-aminohexanoate cleavage enzyme